jgi:hypothetical protein
MSGFSGSPRLLKAGLVLLDPVTGVVRRVIPLQYNPDTLTRTLQTKGGEAGDRAEALRLTGPPVETLKLDAEIDATDQLEFPDQNPGVVATGVQPFLSAMEMVLYPSSSQIQRNAGLAAAGTLEILPVEAPLVLFVWSKNRIVPVKITEFSITEEAFDTQLNPIRAKVSLGLRVLNVNDFSSNHRGASLFLAYQQQKERLASENAGTALAALGLNGIP